MNYSIKHVLLVSLLILIHFYCIPSASAAVPTGFTHTTFVSGLSAPTSMEFSPDGRLFVCEKAGTLRVIKNGSLLSTPFLTVSVNSAGERGLLGVTFDPNFTSNNFIYVYYTTSSSPIHNRISRFVANGDVVVPNSEVIILELNTLTSATNHNGGAIHFGNDGKLYAAVGENATSSNSQTLNNLLGKILRLNSDGTIPSDNPFYSTASGNNRMIYALGLRNPFTFAFDPLSGKMFINDVGQSTWEEINLGSPGANYGWPTCEGTCSNQGFVNPIFAYNHSSGAVVGNAITGGAFYRKTQFPAIYHGQYFFSDYTANWIKVLDPSNNSVVDFASAMASPVDLKVGPDGGLYYASINNGVINIISNITNPTPTPTNSPTQTPIPNPVFTGRFFTTLLTPVSGSTAQGKATVMTNTTGTSMRVITSFSGIAGSVETASHMHGPKPATSIVFPLNASSQVGSERKSDTTITTLSSQQLQDLRGEKYYINVHSTSFPGGEISGDLIGKVRRAGDVDGDNDIDIFDYNQVVSEFGNTGIFLSDVNENVNNPGGVDIFDYNFVVSNFGT